MHTKWSVIGKESLILQCGAGRRRSAAGKAPAQVEALEVVTKNGSPRMIFDSGIGQSVCLGCSCCPGANKVVAQRVQLNGRARDRCGLRVAVAHGRTKSMHLDSESVSKFA